MRIIKEKTLKDYLTISRYKSAKIALQDWVTEIKKSNFANSAALKEKYGTASIITSKRVVFNIKGNDYRLVVDIEYLLEIVFIVWFGTHMEYDVLDIKKLSYEYKANKNK